jgi:hypothetical protein
MKFINLWKKAEKIISGGNGLLSWLDLCTEKIFY